MDREYNIGQLVLFNERISDTMLLPILGWIVNKYFDEDNRLLYTIEWTDGFVEGALQTLYKGMEKREWARYHGEA